jgi:hypothetical protein
MPNIAKALVEPVNLAFRFLQVGREKSLQLRGMRRLDHLW